jgi:hypothetical protein
LLARKLPGGVFKYVFTHAMDDAYVRPFGSPHLLELQFVQNNSFFFPDPATGQQVRLL